MLKSLRDDPNSRLVITFHGNAGHVGQGWRPTFYHTVVGAAPDHMHVVAFDYRGFGYSTGFPTEEGLIQDGIQMMYWALQDVKIPPQRIVLFGQSLGTAVATAVAEHFAVKESLEFAGLVLVAPFYSIPELLPEYTLGGFIPTFSPLKMYPTILKWATNMIVDTWNTSERLANLVQKSKTFNIALIHAKNDAEIPSRQSKRIFDLATNTTTHIGARTHEETVGGGWTDTWTVDDSKRVKLIINPSGGHNQIMTYPIVSKAILDCFDGVKD